MIFDGAGNLALVGELWEAWETLWEATYDCQASILTLGVTKVTTRVPLTAPDRRTTFAVTQASQALQHSLYSIAATSTVTETLTASLTLLQQTTKRLHTCLASTRRVEEAQYTSVVQGRWKVDKRVASRTALSTLTHSLAASLAIAAVVGEWIASFRSRVRVEAQEQNVLATVAQAATVAEETLASLTRINALVAILTATRVSTAAIEEWSRETATVLSTYTPLSEEYTTLATLYDAVADLYSTLLPITAPDDRKIATRAAIGYLGEVIAREVLRLQSKITQVLRLNSAIELKNPLLSSLDLETPDE